MDCIQVLNKIRNLADASRVGGMARHGISGQRVLGVSMPKLTALARETGRSHVLALQLFDSGIHEARILAAMVAQPGLVTPELMDAWAHQFDSWDVCDQCCMRLFRLTPHAWAKAREWAGADEEFVKRAGFALMATLAVHDKKASDADFESLLDLIAREAGDPRNFVKKAVNWALRQIGKRNRALNVAAIKAAREIGQRPEKAPRWIAVDALRELASQQVQERLK